MKKVFLIAVLAVLGLGNLNAQGGSFNAGVNLGLPIGDLSSFYSFTASAEVNYLFEVSDKFKVGPSISYHYDFGKKNLFGPGLDAQNGSYLPLAAAGRYAASKKLTFGADLGYGFEIGPNFGEGYFYYRPMVGYAISEKLMLQATYSAMSQESYTFSNFGVGIMFGF